MKDIKSQREHNAIFPQVLFCDLKWNRTLSGGRSLTMGIDRSGFWVASNRNRFWTLWAEKEHTKAVTFSSGLPRLCKACMFSMDVPRHAAKLSSRGCGPSHPHHQHPHCQPSSSMFLQTLLQTLHLFANSFANPTCRRACLVVPEPMREPLDD